MNNKGSAIKFLQMIVSGKIKEAFHEYLDKNFIHHNPYFEANPDALMQGMIDSHTQFPNKVFEIKIAIQEGNYVFVHSRLLLTPGQPAMAVVHIFRFKENKIAEFWDIGQQIPEENPNKNGMF